MTIPEKKIIRHGDPVHCQICGKQVGIHGDGGAGLDFRTSLQTPDPALAETHIACLLWCDDCDPKTLAGLNTMQGQFREILYMERIAAERDDSPR